MVSPEYFLLKNFFKTFHFFFVIDCFNSQKVIKLNFFEIALEIFRIFFLVLKRTKINIQKKLKRRLMNVSSEFVACTTARRTKYQRSAYGFRDKIEKLFLGDFLLYFANEENRLIFKHGVLKSKRDYLQHISKE